MSVNQNNSKKQNKGTALTRRTFLTFTVGAVLSGFFLFYNVLITPLAKPTLLKKKKVSGTPQEKYFQPPIYKKIADKYLSHYSWVKEASYLAKTNASYIYSRKMSEEGAELFLEPFAMVLMRPDKDGNEQAYTIHCPHAIVEFQNKLEVGSSNGLGRIIGGRLVGNVTITGPDNLKIDGRNFFFKEDAKKIFSDRDIKFDYQTHSGTATGIDIELFQDKTRDKIDQLSFNNAQRIILRKNVKIRMVEQNEGNKKSEVKLERLAVLSEGNFNFDLIKMIATFEKNVRVLHPDLKNINQIDKLHCDRLTMTLDESLMDDQKKKPEKKQSGDSKNGIQENISIKRMVASGKKVKLESSGNNLVATMNNLVYDRLARLVTMTSNKKVEIVRDRNTIHAPLIKAKHTIDNEITHTWCLGEGDMVFHNEEDGKIAFSANWKKELSIQPDQNLSSGLDLIIFKEKAQIKQPLENTGLAAESIYVWVKRNEEDKSKKTARKNKADSGSSLDDASGNFDIQRMLAVDKVVMINPQMNAKTDRLQVYFEKPKQAHVKNSATQKPAKPDPKVKLVEYNSAPEKSSKNLLIPESNEQATKNAPPSLLIIPSDNQPLSNTQVLPQAKSEPPKRVKPQDKPAVIEANLIKVRILVNEDKKITDPKKASGSKTAMNNGTNQLDEVLARGNVHVTQNHINGDAPMDILCDALLIKDDSNTLFIYGGAEHVENKYLNEKQKAEHPAHIRDRGFHISGRVIEMDRKNNKAKVDGAGLLELPVTESMDGKKLASPQKLDIWWDDNMTFDGKQANFYGNVRTDMDKNRITCEEMNVVLKEKINFAEVDQIKQPKTKDKNKKKADIETLDCFGNVSFHSEVYKEGYLEEVRDGTFSELHMNRDSGKTIAQGPGKIKSWRKGNSLSPGQRDKKEEVKKDSDKKWQYSRILFYDKTKGNLNNYEMSFTGRINIINGPVDHVLEELDPDYLPEDAGLMRCDTLQVVHHRDKTKVTDGHFEMIASGNAILESGIRQISADQITYNQSQDLYIARSVGKQKATVWQESDSGGEGSSVRAQTIKLIPRTNWLDLDNATSLEGSFFGE